MNQHNSNVGAFDPNKNEYQMNHMVYDCLPQQSQHIQQQPGYVMQSYDIVDSSNYLLDNQHQALNQPLTSYGIDYSNSQQVSMANIPYYDPNPSMVQHHVVYEQASPVPNAGQQYYVSNTGGQSNQLGYMYYQDQSGDMLHHNQYGQIEQQGSYGNMSGMNMMGHMQQLRPQPMTTEQIQLSQQRLLGIQVPIRTQQEPLQMQHSQSQVQQQQQQQRHLHPQQQQLQSTIPHSQSGQTGYGNQTYTTAAPATTTTTTSHGSPAGSSYTSSGTDISDEGDELFGAPSPYKRSPPADATLKRQGKKRKMQKDPNEPQKPVSAYALFFRDTQAAIKGQNPSASFGDVSKIVASMWDHLEKEGKEMYKQKTEMAKKDYLKQLAAYRANLLSRGNHTISGSPFADPLHQQSIQKSSSQGQTWLIQSDTSTSSAEIGGKTLASLISEPKPQQVLTATTTSVLLQQSSFPRAIRQEMVVKSELSPAVKPEGMCIRPGCTNPAVECPQWDGEYCNDECVSKNCRDIFTAWVQSKQQTQVTEAVAPS